MSITMRDDAFESTRQRLQLAIPNLVPELGQSGEGRWILLPASPGADYRWSFWFYPSGERHIYATEVDPSSETEPKGHVLWYHPFELDGYDRSEPSLAGAFDLEVNEVLHSRTRILQHRGLVNWDIRLEREGEGGWQVVYRFFALRGAWVTRGPPTGLMTYYAPAFL